MNAGIIALLFSLSSAFAFDCLDIARAPQERKTIATHPDSDFNLRDHFFQTEIPAQQWQSCCGSFGPCPVTYPKVEMAKKNQDHTLWIRQRIIAAAKKYLGLSYAHFHIPAMGGLDCSNFTAWVYNYSLGLRFSSNILTQSLSAGRRLAPAEDLAEGDLVFLWDEEFKRISHVAIYMNENQVIDSSGTEVKIRSNSGRYRDRLAWARRIIE